MSLVRDFTLGGAIRTLIGSCDTTGPFTWVGYMRFTEASTGWIIARQDSGFSGASNWTSLGREGGQLVGYPSVSSGINPPNSKWVLVVMTKEEAGSSPFVFYYYNFATKAWTKVETPATATNHTGTPTRLQFGKWNGGEQFNGLYAAAAIFESYFTPTEVHALAEVSFVEDWLTMTPAGLWIFDQEAANKEVVDLTGNGADGSEEMQLTASGTSATEVLLPLAYREGEETGEEEGEEPPPSEHTVKVKVGGSVVTANRWVKQGGILVPA